MSLPDRPSLPTALVFALLALGLAGCATSPFPPARRHRSRRRQSFRRCRRPSRRRISSGAGGLPPTTRTKTGPRIEAAAANQCQQPYVITLGPTGGVMMHLADQAQADGAAPERRARRQDLYRPGRRTARQPAGPRSGCLRRPHADPALDGFGSAGPLRHHGLCALRAGGRKAPGGQAEGQDGRQAEGSAEAGAAADPATAAAVTTATAAVPVTAGSGDGLLRRRMTAPGSC